MKKTTLSIFLALFTIVLVGCNISSPERNQEDVNTASPSDNDIVINKNEQESNLETGEEVEQREVSVGGTVELEKIGEIPEFSVETLEGKTVTNKSLLDSNKPSLVYFTASWCPTCAKNWPALEAVYQDYKDNVNFLSIGIDPTDTQEVISNLAQKEGLTYPMTPGYPQVMVDFGVTGQATTVGVDREGNIVYKATTKELSEDDYRDLLESLLNN